jgi:hypothetical protein
MLDVGTRFSHLSDLYELWQTGLDILERYDKNNPFYEDKKDELENALRLLLYHMEKDYNDHNYAVEINNLPPVDEIKN